MTSFRGRRITQQGANLQDEIDACKHYGLEHFQGIDNPGLGLDRIHYGSNSGYQAINLAFLLGAKRIILLGYDMLGVGDHFFGRHPKGLSQDTNYSKYVPEFRQLADDLKEQGVEVFNCTRQTALSCFRKLTIDNLCAR